MSALRPARESIPNKVPRAMFACSKDLNRKPSVYAVNRQTATVQRVASAGYSSEVLTMSARCFGFAVVCECSALRPPALTTRTNLQAKALRAIENSATVYVAKHIQQVRQKIG